VFARVEQQLPAIVDHLTAEIGANIDQLIDAKLMVITYFEAHPQLICDLFQVIGKKELRFMQNFGFYFGIRWASCSSRCCTRSRTGTCCRSAG